MAPYQAMQIPDPMEALARVHSVKNIAMQSQQREQQMQAAQRDQQENAQITAILQRSVPKTPEEADRIFEEINAINPQKAIEVLETLRSLTAPKDPGQLVQDETGAYQPRHAMVGKKGYVEPTPGPTPGSDAEYYAPQTTPERRAEIERGRKTLAEATRAPQAEPAGTDYTRALKRFAKEKRKDVDDLTSEEELTFRRRYEATNDRPAAEKTVTGLTAAQKAAAERWRNGELSKLEREYRASQTKKPYLNSDTIEWVIPEPMPREEYEAAKAQIQQSYFRQLGVEPGAPPTTNTPAVPDPPAAPARRVSPGAADRTSTPTGPVKVLANGKTFSFPTQAAADGFRKAAGIQTPSVGQRVKLSSGKWVVIKSIRPDGSFEY